MDIPPDDAIERLKVREVTAIFHSHEALEAAVTDLLLAGFDRADIDRLADLNEVQKRLGWVYVAHEELADVPQAPRQPVVLREDITAVLALVVSVTGSFACCVTGLIVVAFGGGTASAVIAGLLAGLVASGLGALLTLRIVRPPQSRALEPIMAAEGLVLWVRTRTPDREGKAFQILHEHGGQAIRVHEVEIEKRAEDIPLSSLQPDPWLEPDPWLGNEHPRQP
jgi:hypothetical protein